MLSSALQCWYLYPVSAYTIHTVALCSIIITVVLLLVRCRYSSCCWRGPGQTRFWPCLGVALPSVPAWKWCGWVPGSAWASLRPSPTGWSLTPPLVELTTLGRWLTGAIDPPHAASHQHGGPWGSRGRGGTDADGINLSCFPSCDLTMHV